MRRQLLRSLVDVLLRSGDGKRRQIIESLDDKMKTELIEALRVHLGSKDDRSTDESANDFITVFRRFAQAGISASDAVEIFGRRNAHGIR